MINLASHPASWRALFPYLEFLAGVCIWAKQDVHPQTSKYFLTHSKTLPSYLFIQSRNDCKVFTQAVHHQQEQKAEICQQAKLAAQEVLFISDFDAIFISLRCVS